MSPPKKWGFLPGFQPRLTRSNIPAVARSRPLMFYKCTTHSHLKTVEIINYCCLLCSWRPACSCWHTDLYIYLLDAVPLIHVVSNHVATDNLTNKSGGMFTNWADWAEPVSVANHVKAHLSTDQLSKTVQNDMELAEILLIFNFYVCIFLYITCTNKVNVSSIKLWRYSHIFTY